MQIQPYFPEQISIRGNVAGERYVVTLGFVLRTMAGHFASVLAVVVVALIGQPILTKPAALWVFVGSLLALTVVRRVLNGRFLDNLASTVLMIPTLWSLGTLLGILAREGQAVWIVGVGYLFASAYAMFCGRDFSFVGQFVLSVAATAAVSLATALAGVVAWEQCALWLAAAAVYNSYFVYDLAALLSRRRLREEPAAVADLYRDMLNFLTYSVRVYLHWRRFRFI